MLMLACTGSEANELALRIAQVMTGGAGGSVRISRITAIPRPSRRSPRCFLHRKAWGRTFARSHRLTAIEGCAASAAKRFEDAYVGEVRSAIESLQENGIQLGAMLVCTLFSSEGLPNVPPGYMRRAVELVRKAGGLYIADEVQGGFGRAGRHVGARAILRLCPTFVTLGKPMGNGHPISGVVGRAILHSAVGERAMYFNTFGGNPVSCAAANAVLDVLERETCKTMRGRRATSRPRGAR